MDLVRTVDVPALYTRATIGSVDEENRTFELIWSTGAEARRRDMFGQQFTEVLSMKPEHVRLGRLNAGASLLDTHMAGSLRNVLGAAIDNTAKIVNGIGTAVYKFSRRPDAEPYWQDVKDKVIRHVSIGYSVHKFLEERAEKGGIPRLTAVDWEPFETSLVPVAVDAGAQVRALNADMKTACVFITRSSDGDRLRRLRLAHARS